MNQSISSSGKLSITTSVPHMHWEHWQCTIQYDTIQCIQWCGGVITVCTVHIDMCASHTVKVTPREAM